MTVPSGAVVVLDVGIVEMLDYIEEHRDSKHILVNTFRVVREAIDFYESNGMDATGHKERFARLEGKKTALPISSTAV